MKIFILPDFIIIHVASISGDFAVLLVYLHESVRIVDEEVQILVLHIELTLTLALAIKIAG